jgi:hypothetical protein
VKTLDEIATNGHSKQWLYRRIVALEEAGLMEARRGPANTILLDPIQEGLLQKLISLEANCKRTRVAIEKLRYEIALAENARLRAELKQRDEEIQRLHALVEVRRPWWRAVLGWFARARRGRRPGG